MDLYGLGTEAARALAPFLPALVAGGKGLGGKALEEMGKQTGGALWLKGKEVWEKLQGSLESSAEKREELETIASHDDVDLRTTELSSFLTRLMQQEPQAQIQFAKTIQNISNSSNFTNNFS